MRAFSPLLNNGITLAIFNSSGYSPVKTDLLKNCTSGFMIIDLHIFKNFTDILSKAEDFFYLPFKLIFIDFVEKERTFYFVS